ncbi:hypothetical protein SERLADRAFT_401051 [Serpula lacrymans var. lacrymans S7.9]|uniref:Probable RNA-binding protein 18 n=1 Tax=Serpula lacrymans var. lacrymans (strain S7.9) TaxID=578457 RepID=F8PAJ5_SERL9|nr:uncharacterized protein SERLADRAFT_401051 [Serpula lacrymans var. lacrymans S7.9]EGO19834.1 hypothetical protein SERLADRAFT_401051 [Serpula lacrymans var. lacrymans S7.9]
MSNEIDLEHSLGESSTTTSHLYIPPQEEAVESVSAPSAARTPQLLKDRLYIGNLHPTVDEYTLLQIFSKFGKISKLDFLFHKTGPSKGKPRGYAFVEFINQKDANKALDGANDKLLRGRKLVVTYAHQAPLDQNAGGAYNGKRRMADAYRPTALSILKSATGGRQDRIKSLRWKPS